MYCWKLYILNISIFWIKCNLDKRTRFSKGNWKMPQCRWKRWSSQIKTQKNICIFLSRIFFEVYFVIIYYCHLLTVAVVVIKWQLPKDKARPRNSIKPLSKFLPSKYYLKHFSKKKTKKEKDKHKTLKTNHKNSSDNVIPAKEKFSPWLKPG